MKTKFTPGPWKIEDASKSVTDTYRIKSSNDSVAIICGSQANAALISAAPEMFKALELTLNTCRTAKDLDKALVNIALNIAGVLQKARGE